MGLISITNPADGESIDAADVSTPFNTIKNVINGNLDNDNIASDAAIAWTKMASTAWTATSGLWNNVTLGSGATDAVRYMVMGKTLIVTGKLVLGTGGDVTGSLSMTLPNSYTTANQTVDYVGVARATDSGTSHYVLATQLSANDTTIGFYDENSSVVGASVPFDWTNGDSVSFTITCEIA